MQGSYVIYQSEKAAQVMFQAMKLFPDQLDFGSIHYVTEEIASVNFKIAELKSRIDHLQY